jgi:DNA-binding NarL/FixJ family response regulator
MSENISAADSAYRAEMEAGSYMLLKAITALRNGTCPATPVKPYRLPPDWSDRVNPYGDKPKERAKYRPSNERVIELIRQGFTAGQIAARLKISTQKATAIMAAIKLAERASERRAA